MVGTWKLWLVPAFLPEEPLRLLSVPVTATGGALPAFFHGWKAPPEKPEILPIVSITVCCPALYIDKNSFHADANIQIYRNPSDSQNFRQKICEFDISLQR